MSEFSYKEKVIVASGFYKGQRGEIVGRRSYKKMFRKEKTNYLVSMQDIEVDVIFGPKKALFEFEGNELKPDINSVGKIENIKDKEC